jgi:hypothetical protein
MLNEIVAFDVVTYIGFFGTVTISNIEHSHPLSTSRESFKESVDAIDRLP